MNASRCRLCRDGLGRRAARNAAAARDAVDPFAERLDFFRTIGRHRLEAAAVDSALHIVERAGPDPRVHQQAAHRQAHARMARAALRAAAASAVAQRPAGCGIADGALDRHRCLADDVVGGGVASLDQFHRSFSRIVGDVNRASFRILAARFRARGLAEGPPEKGRGTARREAQTVFVTRPFEGRVAPCGAPSGGFAAPGRAFGLAVGPLRASLVTAPFGWPRLANPGGPFGLAVSELLAGGRSAPGRNPGAARVRAPAQDAPAGAGPIPRAGATGSRPSRGSGGEVGIRS
jgi:hypothetical protein